MGLLQSILDLFIEGVGEGLFWKFKFNLLFMSTLLSENTEFVRIQIDIRKTQSPDIASQQDPYLHLFPEFVRQRRCITIPEPENRQESGNKLRNPEPGND